MKIIMLAAGHGLRLKPLTDTTPKCLVKINDVPLLEIWLNLLLEQGFSEVLICTHYMSSKVEKFIDNYKQKKPALNITIKYEEKLLGTAGAVWFNQDYIGDDDFAVINADNLSDINLRDIYNFHKEHDQLATLTYFKVDDPAGVGIIELGKDSIINRFEEKPKIPFSNLAYAGIQVLNSEIFKLLPFEERKNRNYSNIDFGYDVFPKLSGKMVGYELNCFLMDIRDVESYDLAQRLWQN